MTNKAWTAIRAVMEHHATDHPEIAELKRLWWTVYNNSRVYTDLLPSSIPLLDEIEALVMCMQEQVNQYVATLDSHV
jgi:hypothetical protein